MSSSNSISKTLIGIVITIVIPVIVLTRFSSDSLLGPIWSLVLALSLPLFYGLYEFRDKKNINIYAVIGVVSVVLTGGIGLLKLSPQVLAIKEAAVPFIISLTILGSQKAKKPIVPTLLNSAIDDELVEKKLAELGNSDKYQRVVRRATHLFAASFLLSTILNYALARMIVTSAPGTTAFNEELGKLTALSYPAIALPSMIVMIFALQYLIKGIKTHTGLSLGEILKTDE